ncbi:MAG: hypothetical protein J5704_01240 [Paludibacteraceae bacterium]|nr:hypothetical protein [Paludibacteraceae bacterium]
MEEDYDKIISAGVSKEEINQAMESYAGYVHAPLLATLLKKLLDDDSDMLFALKARKYLAEIEDVNTRRNVFFAFDNKLRNDNNYEILNGLNRYHYVLESCVFSEARQREYNQKINGDIISLDTSLYYDYIGKDEQQTHAEFLYFSQALYYFSSGKSKYNFDATQLPVFVELFKDKFPANSIIDFCQSLLDAERYRRRVCLNKEVPHVTVKEFSIFLRQFCFNAYYDYRTSEKFENLLQNNDRPEAVTQRQAKIEVFKKENKALKDAKEQNINEDVWKLAYYFVWFVGKDLGLSVPEEREDFSSDEFQIPNFNNQIDKRIKAVFKAKVCKKQADWAAVFKLLMEEGVHTKSEYAAGAARINAACGKDVTTAKAIMQSAALEIIDGKWKGEGWKDKLHNKTSGTLMIRYMAIANAFYK